MNGDSKYIAITKPKILIKIITALDNTLLHSLATSITPTIDPSAKTSNKLIVQQTPRNSLLYGDTSNNIKNTIAAICVPIAHTNPKRLISPSVCHIRINVYKKEL
jgi:hypothetical protein